ncbi:MAG: cytochrome c biogenesis protein ResB [Chloroflexi bacterium]|nr:cytochrome c biogenesis protein ResB [Chloroflexota bacterium]
MFDDLWSLFSSPKLALGLILAIAAASLAGALIMQVPSEMFGNADAVRTWVERARPRYGVLTDLFGTLGLFWVFQTMWFRALLGLLALNTIVCTVNRLPGIWRQVFEPRVRPGEGLFERGKPRETAHLASESLDAARPTVRAALRRRGYRVVEQVEPQGVYLYADRFRLARFGTLLSHTGLVLVFLGVVASEPLGFFQEQGFAVPVGSTREVGHNTGLSVYVDDFADEYHPDGRPKDYRSEVVLFDQGREVARATVRVNEPLAYNGVRFHQAYYGQATIVSATEPGGKTLFRDAVALTWRSNDGERPVGYFFLPTRDLHVYLVGTAGEGDPVVRPGELLVEAYRGNVSTPTYRATLTQRRPLKIADVEFLFERELPFTGLRVVRDPGAPIVWLACVLLVVGFMLAFYFPHRRLWARLRAEPGGIEVTLVGAGQEMAEELRRVLRSSDFGFWILDFGLGSDPNPKSRIQNPKSGKSRIQNPKSEQACG